MGLHGLTTDEEPISDLCVAHALERQVRDLPLRRRQAIPSVRRSLALASRAARVRDGLGKSEPATLLNRARVVRVTHRGTCHGDVARQATALGLNVEAEADFIPNSSGSPCQPSCLDEALTR